MNQPAKSGRESCAGGQVQRMWNRFPAQANSFGEYEVMDAPRRSRRRAFSNLPFSMANITFVHWRIFCVSPSARKVWSKALAKLQP